MKGRFLSPEAGILLLAVVLRFAFLDVRPAHFDEGVNGWFADKMTREGTFAYDPTNYHGPLHFYAVFCSQTLFGRNLWALRLPPALVGVATVALALAFRPFLGVAATRLAALFFAVSPAFVYYARYSIHESWLSFFALLTLWGLAALWRSNSAPGLWALCCGITGMAITKETYVLHLAAFALAWPCLLLWEKVSPSSDPDPLPQRAWGGRDLAAAIGVNLLLFVFFYSGNFLHWQGIPDAFRTFATWFETGVKSGGHDKPFHYWLGLFARYEWLGLAGLAACLRCLWPAPRLPRFLAICGGGTLLAYSLIPYKTPWCVLAVLWPFLLLAGWWGAELLRSEKRALAWGAVALLVLLGSWDAIRVSLFNCTSDAEPYVYVQTYHDLDRFTAPLLLLAADDPAAHHLRGTFLLESYYPLPWILGEFTRIAYHTPPGIPADPDAAFLLVDEDLADALEEQLKGDYYVEEIRVRAAQQPARAYFSKEIFAPLFGYY